MIQMLDHHEEKISAYLRGEGACTVALLLACLVDKMRWPGLRALLLNSSIVAWR